MRRLEPAAINEADVRGSSGVLPDRGSTRQPRSHADAAALRPPRVVAVQGAVLQADAHAPRRADRGARPDGRGGLSILDRPGRGSECPRSVRGRGPPPGAAHAGTAGQADGAQRARGRARGADGADAGGDPGDRGMGRLSLHAPRQRRRRRPGGLPVARQRALRDQPRRRGGQGAACRPAHGEGPGDAASPLYGVRLAHRAGHARESHPVQGRPARSLRDARVCRHRAQHRPDPSPQRRSHAAGRPAARARGHAAARQHGHGPAQLRGVHRAGVRSGPGRGIWSSTRMA